VKHRLSDLLDIPRLQSALDSLYISSKIPSAIIDNDGKVHAGSGWQDVCTKFHRVHPEARKRCIESDLYITDHIHEANPSITYKCPHGLVDSATPIIIDGEHIGNVFTGQLFLEKPDLDFFRSQGKTYGFDEDKYINAVKKVPIIPERSLQENLAFVVHLTGMLAEMGLKRARDKEAEKRLRESEERYRSLFGKASDGISIMSPDGNLIEVNDSFARMHGYSTGELLQMNIKDLDTPKTAILIPERMRRLLAEEILSVEVEHHHKDGHVFPLEVSAGLIFIGEEPFIQCFHRDITDRRRAEEILHQTNELFRSAFEEAPGGMCLVSPEGRFLRVNNAFCIMLERPESELLAMSFMDVTHPEDRSVSREWVEQILAGDDVPKTLEKRYLRKSGHVMWGMVGSYLLHSDDGAPLLFITHIQDITERKRAEEALLESETRYRSIFDSSADGIVIIDPGTSAMIDFNQQACTQLGYTREEFGCLKISDIDLLDGTEEVKARIQKVIKTGYDEFETLHRTKHGGQRNVHVTAQYISIGGKSLQHCICRDITERKHAEAEKERLQVQLQQAMKMEAVGRLAGGVAHDFNNLLTVIIGYSELLLQEIEKKSQMHGQVEEIKRAGDRAASLTQQLLAFSRKQIIEPKVVHLDHLVAEMHKMLARLIGENIVLQATTGKSLGSVKVDPGQFQQILMNLVVNARDAMPDGGKIVIETANVDLDEWYCSLHSYVKPGRFVMLAVSDTGIGMSEEVKAHIFEPFFTTKEKGSGTGLGLATTYGAVHQAGGSIEVYSEVGIGTTIKIFLPRVEGQDIKLMNNHLPTDLPGGTETVLVVEDEGILRNLCVQILEQLGYKVLQARKGTEAIAEVQGYGDRIDLLLTDVVMPGMNGSELATQLVLHNPDLKVLFTSGYTEDVISHHGVLAEGVCFIGKPYTPSSLAKKVREVLGKA
jgi:PAS domain S-box-containing protein